MQMPTIHEVINARATKGNARWWNWYNENRFGRERSDAKDFDRRCRINQSSIHTYEVLGVANRYETIGICKFRLVFTDREFRAHIIQLWREARAL